jgi:hypothetical protein
MEANLKRKPDKKYARTSDVAAALRDNLRKRKGTVAVAGSERSERTAEQSCLDIKEKI